MPAAILAVLLATAPLASAQNADEETAKKEYALGWRALQAGDYAEALDHYERSYELVPRPRTLFNIATAEEKLGRLRDALLHYMEFLEQAEDRDREFADQAQKKLAELKKVVLGRLKITSVPKGAEVYVDDSPMPTGKTPLTVELAAGTYLVKVAARAREPVERAVEVVAGRRVRERFVLAAKAPPVVEAKPVVPGHIDGADSDAGTLVIHTNIAGATVSVDGIVVGTTSLANASKISTPMLHHRAASGEHSVIVEQPGGRAWRKQLHVSPDETVTVEVEFRHRSPKRRRLVTWGLAGLGAASVAAGGTLGVLAIRDVTQPTPDDHDRGKSRALMADFLLVGGAAAILGAWWLERKPATSAHIQRTHGRVGSDVSINR